MIANSNLNYLCQQEVVKDHGLQPLALFQIYRGMSIHIPHLGPRP